QEDEHAREQDERYGTRGPRPELPCDPRERPVHHAKTGQPKIQYEDRRQEHREADEMNGLGGRHAVLAVANEYDRWPARTPLRERQQLREHGPPRLSFRTGTPSCGRRQSRQSRRSTRGRRTSSRPQVFGSPDPTPPSSGRKSSDKQPR